jgi:hypothetical protein
MNEPEIRKLTSISSAELLTVAPVEQVEPVRWVTGYKAQK